MRLYNYLKEEYHGLIKKPSGGIPIFKNPDRKEMREAGDLGTIRYIVDITKKNIYVWDGYSVLHLDVIRKLNLKLDLHFRGEGEWNGTKIIDNHFSLHGVDYIKTSKKYTLKPHREKAEKWILDNKSFLSKFFDSSFDSPAMISTI